MIDVAMDTRLKAVAGLTALVGQRIYPILLPHNATFPAVTHQQISGPRVTRLNSDPGVVEGRWQVDSWGETHMSALLVAAQVRAALKRYRGTNDTTEILDVYLDEESQDYDEAVKRYFVTQDYKVWWRE